jgi:hypothetical protein
MINSFLDVLPPLQPVRPLVLDAYRLVERVPLQPPLILAPERAELLMNAADRAPASPRALLAAKVEYASESAAR